MQGIVWIKERESTHNLHVVRMGAPSTVTAMERAMEAGHSVLIENMGENIDAVLNPVITRSTFKKVLAITACRHAGSLHEKQRFSLSALSALLVPLLHLHIVLGVAV